MDNIAKKTRLEFLFEKFKLDYAKAIEKNLFRPRPTVVDVDGENDVLNQFYDNDFMNFAISFRSASLRYEKQYDKLFYFLVDCDPTDNKEYVSWLLNLFSQQLKDRVSIRDGYTDNVMSVVEINNFYEDIITKGKEALEVFSFLKKTNVLHINRRDINQYKTLTNFLDMVKPYLIKDDGDDSVHTLDHKELQCIHNFVEFGKEPDDKEMGSAELVFENDKWVIVITHNKLANTEFGKFTTWCTAGTRWGSMFESYHGRGELFVLIRKGYGSKKEIKERPEYRLQFHFEDDQFMDANDKRIDINKFLFNNKEVKDYFKSYIVKTALPRRRAKNMRQMDEIKYLLGLGFGDEIIKILKESKPESMDFSQHIIEMQYLDNIGEVTSLKKLDLTECKLTYLPESIRHLKNLKYLKFRNNTSVTKIPDWVSELTNLETLDCAGCDIEEIGDLSGNTNLKELVIDFNKNLKNLPKNVGKLTNLTRLTASSCDIRSIEDELVNCPLFLLDIHSNKNLSKIPTTLSKIPSIEAICVDDTSIPNTLIKEMENNSNGRVCILKYG
jgi:hypothetical protein